MNVYTKTFAWRVNDGASQIFSDPCGRFDWTTVREYNLSWVLWKSYDRVRIRETRRWSLILVRIHDWINLNALRSVYSLSVVSFYVFHLVVDLEARLWQIPDSRAIIKRQPSIAEKKPFQPRVKLSQCWPKSVQRMDEHLWWSGFSIIDILLLEIYRTSSVKSILVRSSISAWINDKLWIRGKRRTYCWMCHLLTQSILNIRLF